MVNPIATIVKAFHKWRLKQDLKIAIHKARELRYLNHKKYFVLYLQGNFQVVEKQQLKSLLQGKRFFKKGVSMRTLEQAAYYITD